MQGASLLYHAWSSRCILLRSLLASTRSGRRSTGGRRAPMSSSVVVLRWQTDRDPRFPWPVRPAKPASWPVLAHLASTLRATQNLQAKYETPPNLSGRQPFGLGFVSLGQKSLGCAARDTALRVSIARSYSRVHLLLCRLRLLRRSCPNQAITSGIFRGQQGGGRMERYDGAFT